MMRSIERNNRRHCRGESTLKVFVDSRDLLLIYVHKVSARLVRVLANLLNAAMCAGYAFHFAHARVGEPILWRLCLVLPVIAAVVALDKASRVRRSTRNLPRKGTQLLSCRPRQ